MDYFLARYYSSAQGRFTSIDPQNAGTTKKDPQSWNAYEYGRNNPMKYVDPDGLKYKLTDTNENSIDDYADDDFNKNLRRNKNIKLKTGNIYQNGELTDSHKFRRRREEKIGAFRSAVGSYVFPRFP